MATKLSKKKRFLKHTKSTILKASKKWLTYDKITSRIKNIPAIDVNFKNSKYSFGKKYHFPYSLSSAQTIIESATEANNIFSLLQKNFFEDTLNLYSSEMSFEHSNPDIRLSVSEQFSFEDSAFTKSQLTQREYFRNLEVFHWSYSEFIISAVFFYLETLHSEQLLQKTQIFSPIKLAFGKIAKLYLSPIFGEDILKTIRETNILSKFSLDCLYGFTRFIRTKCSMTNNKIQNCKRLWSLVNNCFQRDFFGLSRYLAAFNFMIPRVLIKYVSHYCIQTRSISLIYYILKQYQNILDYSLSDNVRFLEHYALGKYLYEEIHSDNDFESSVDSTILNILLIFFLLELSIYKNMIMGYINVWI